MIPALAGRNDVIFTDRLNHASIYDGCSLSKAKIVRFRHNDLHHLEELLRRQRGKAGALIVVESLYSMDGDRCPPPAVIGASLAAIRLVRQQPELRADLFRRVDFFKAALRDNGLTDLGPSQIVPILTGDSGRAVRMAQLLRDQGVYATAVRPPTVPRGTARLRFSITRHLGSEELARTAALVGAALRAV